MTRNKTQQEAYDAIAALAEHFAGQIEVLKKTQNETETRIQFINPLFNALGWDIDNTRLKLPDSYRDVIHEDKLKISGKTKAPDYCFTNHGKRLFFLEAKKPSVHIKTDVAPSYQLRRYGWSAKLPISVLTDFEEFALYDCSRQPKENDATTIGRLKYFTFEQYLSEFDWLWDLFAKEQVVKGSLDQFARADKKGTQSVDYAFLQSLDEWRNLLAVNVALRNKNLDEDAINYVVQMNINRIVFLRNCEDRGVEPYGKLGECLAHSKQEGAFFKNLYATFEEADRKYNSGLFDFTKDALSKSLAVDNKTLQTIVSELYYPKSPYEFSVIGVEILGTAYERFLGKVIRLTPGHQAKVEEKPEVRKAGGVYYTPQYIVEYIVKNTVGPLTEEKTPAEIARLKICDPACGSGSFLLGAYRFLLNHRLDYYLAHPAAAKKDKALTPQNTLATAVKKQILLDNLFGVDIDAQAVEVTKLSLLMKCMEGETQASLQTALTFERVLPTLDDNIKCGNSLIDFDFYDGQLDFGDFPPLQASVQNLYSSDDFESSDEVRILRSDDSKSSDRSPSITSSRSPVLGGQRGAVKPFNWKNAFPQVFKQGGFDAVIGNPPYVRQELLGEQKTYFSKAYQVYHGTADLYSYFFEKGLKILNDAGLFGIIVANKWMRANYGEPLRKFLKNKPIRQIIDFGDLPVFQQATTYPMIFIAGKIETPSGGFLFCNIKTLDFNDLESHVVENQKALQNQSLDDAGWNLADESEQGLLSKIQQAGVPLKEYVNGKIFRGVLTGLNEAFVIDEKTKERLMAEDPKSAEVIRPFLEGKDIKRFQPPKQAKYLILFPKGFTNRKNDTSKNAWQWLEKTYPAIAKHLKPFQEKAEKRYDKGEFWWELRACDYYGEFEKAKIIYPNILKRPEFTFDENNWYTNQKCFIIPTSDKYFLGILNSKLNHYLFEKILPKLRGGFYEPSYVFFKNFPIKKINAAEKSAHDEIVKNVDLLLQLNAALPAETDAQKREQAKGRIAFAEQRIDQLVYQLYGLTEAEIRIVEGR